MILGQCKAFEKTIRFGQVFAKPRPSKFANAVGLIDVSRVDQHFQVVAREDPVWRPSGDENRLLGCDGFAQFNGHLRSANVKLSEIELILFDCGIGHLSRARVQLDADYVTAK